MIYYHVAAQAQIRMILIYRKGIKDDLTPREKSVLHKMNVEWTSERYAIGSRAGANRRARRGPLRAIKRDPKAVLRALAA